MWIDTRECVPLADGEYYVQTVYGGVKTMYYTYEGGWNTHRDPDGTLHTKNAINDGYVCRWCKVEAPPTVPTEWADDYNKKGGE